MGTAKEEIKGKAPKHRARTPGAENIIRTVQSLKEEISELTAIKDEDTLSEGDAAKPENARKAATLRAVHSLLSAMEMLLTEY